MLLHVFAFGLRVLCTAPRLLWALLLGLLLAGLNLLWLEELWPNTPGAAHFCQLLALLCALPVPWLLARTAQLVARAVRGWFWRLLWQLTAVGGYVVAFLCAIPGVFGLTALLGNLLD